MRGQLHGCEHAVWSRDAFAGNLKRGAVIGAGARKRQTESDVHAFVKRMQLERDEPLIVIHAKDAVPLAAGGVVKDGVGRERTSEERVISDR